MVIQGVTNISEVSKISVDSGPDKSAVPSSNPALDDAQDLESDSLQAEYTMPKWRLISIFICIAIGLFLTMLDTSIVATALITIGSDFASLGTVTWIALAYTLTYLGFCVIFATVGDVIGRKNAFLAAFTIFFAFSIGCGFAQNIEQLIAMRALQGVGASGLYTLTMVMFPEISPPKLLGFAGGIIGMVIAVAGVLGPVLGGVFTTYTTWRWIFWINGPVSAPAMVLFYLAWPLPGQIRPQVLRSARNLDVVGAILLVAGSVLFVFAFQQAGISSGSWSSALFIGPLVAGLVGWVLLFMWQYLVQKRFSKLVSPVFPFRFLTHRVYIAAVVATLLLGFPFFVIIFSLPQRFQVVNDRTPLEAGVALLPLLFSSATGSFLGGILNSKKNNMFYTLVAGNTFMMLGCASIGTLDPTPDPPARAYGLQILIGLGAGMGISTASLLSFLVSSAEDVAVAQGIVAQVRVLGGSVGIAASTAILGLWQGREVLDTGILTEQQVSSYELIRESLTEPQVLALRKAYSGAFNEGMHVCAGIAGAALLASLLTWQRNAITMAEKRAQLAREARTRHDQAGQEAKARSGGSEK